MAGGVHCCTASVRTEEDEGLCSTVAAGRKFEKQKEKVNGLISPVRKEKKKKREKERKMERKNRKKRDKNK